MSSSHSSDVIQTGLPVCDVEATYRQQHIYQYNSDVELLTELVGADCWAIRIQYRGASTPVTEMNSYPLEGNYIMNTSHPEYVSTPNKVQGRLFRDKLFANPTKYLESADVIEIFMFGTDCWKVVMTRNEANSDSANFDWKVFERRLAV